MIDYMSAMQKAALEKEGITHIINCSPSDCPNRFESDITYLNINIEDNWKTNLFLVIYVILDFLRDALDHHGSVLIHCNQGISRSPSIVIAYLIYTEKITAHAALNKLKQKYPYADPNLDFQIQLDEMYEEVIQEELHLKLKGDKLEHNIEFIPDQKQRTPETPSSIRRGLKEDELLGSESHITISTPDLPQQKLNYHSYIRNQFTRRSMLSESVNLSDNVRQFQVSSISRSAFIKNPLSPSRSPVQKQRNSFLSTVSSPFSSQKGISKLTTRPPSTHFKRADSQDSFSDSDSNDTNSQKISYSRNINSPQRNQNSAVKIHFPWKEDNLKQQVSPKKGDYPFWRNPSPKQNQKAIKINFPWKDEVPLNNQLQPSIQIQQNNVDNQINISCLPLKTENTLINDQIVKINSLQISENIQNDCSKIISQQIQTQYAPQNNPEINSKCDDSFNIHDNLSQNDCEIGQSKDQINIQQDIERGTEQKDQNAKPYYFDTNILHSLDSQDNKTYPNMFITLDFNLNYPKIIIKPSTPLHPTISSHILQNADNQYLQIPSPKIPSQS